MSYTPAEVEALKIADTWNMSALMLLGITKAQILVKLSPLASLCRRQEAELAEAVTRGDHWCLQTKTELRIQAELREKLELETMAHADAVKAHLFYLGRSKQYQERAEAAEQRVRDLEDFAKKYCAPHAQEYAKRLEAENAALNRLVEQKDGALQELGNILGGPVGAFVGRSKQEDERIQKSARIISVALALRAEGGGEAVHPDGTCPASQVCACRSDGEKKA